MPSWVRSEKWLGLKLKVVHEHYTGTFLYNCLVTAFVPETTNGFVIKFSDREGMVYRIRVYLVSGHLQAAAFGHDEDGYYTVIFPGSGGNFLG